MTKRTGKGSGKPAPEVVLSDKDTYKAQPEPDNPKRPTKYSQGVGDAVCSDIADGKSLRSALKSLDRPATRYFYQWLREYEEFRKQYASACEERAEAVLEDAFDIADNGTNDWMFANGHAMTNKEAIERSKLRVEFRKWYATKIKPRKYGDKLDMTTNGKDLPTPILGGLSKKDTTDDIN